MYLCPLADTYKQLRYQIAHLEDGTLAQEYPQLHLFIAEHSLKVADLAQDLLFIYNFLNVYGRKSDATYSRFRNEIERLALWSWCECNLSVFDLKREHIESYIDFVVEPHSKWCNDSVQWRFKQHLGQRVANTKWRPFMAKETKPSQQSLNSTFTALNVFYKFAALEERSFTNYVPVVKKNCPYLVVQSQVNQPDTLTNLQWEYVLRVTEEKAATDPNLERNLFVLACLKGLYLRISELSERANWSPVMSHFWQDADGFWFLRVMGKGNKLRDVTLSDDVLEYLKRYRGYLGLPPLPRVDESQPLVHKLRGQGGMTVRQLRRLVHHSFTIAGEALAKDGFTEDADNLQAASAHWLRHTGASHDAHTRPLKHLSEDLGHAKIATTDQIYIQTNVKERAKSGIKRKL